MFVGTAERSRRFVHSRCAASAPRIDAIVAATSTGSSGSIVGNSISSSLSSFRHSAGFTTDANGKNVLTLFNTTTNGETELIGPSNEIQIYHLHYDASANKVLFDGLRFADNSYVIGTVDLNADQVTVINAGSTKWADLAAFS